MEKKLIKLCMAMLCIVFSFASCDKDEEMSLLEKEFFSVENGTFSKGAFPTSTSGQQLTGVDVSNQVMNGAVNYITIISEKAYKRFFIGMKNVDGYWTYTPGTTRATNDGDGYNDYVIPVMMSDDYDEDGTMLISGEDEDGDVTDPYEVEINYIQTQAGAIEIKLSFSNAKDVDLHVLLPNGEHIYYGHRGGYGYDEEGNEFSYGLDIDSNAGCDIDNINKENVFIPKELVQDGTYTVIVDMFSNCNPSISTNWSIIARYQGEMLSPLSGKNPATGVYPIGASEGDMTRVMTFEIKNATTRSITFDWSSLKAIPLTEMDEFKLRNAVTLL